MLTCARDPGPISLSVRSTVANVYSVMGAGNCRLSSITDEGVKDTDYTQVSASTIAECKSLCDQKSECVAVEVDEGGHHCELWTKQPKFISEGAPKNSCHLKQKPSTG